MTPGSWRACADPAINYNGSSTVGRGSAALDHGRRAVIDEFTSNWRAFADWHTIWCCIRDHGREVWRLGRCCGVDDWSKADVAQFGCWIAASARGRGYATRAVILLTRWLFELGAARVFLKIVAENEVSRIGRRAGTVYEGTMRARRLAGPALRRDVVRCVAAVDNARAR
jgi:RimJ/RimL family protein N-acetyltransferase